MGVWGGEEGPADGVLIQGYVVRVSWDRGGAFVGDCVMRVCVCTCVYILVKIRYFIFNISYSYNIFYRSVR